MLYPLPKFDYEHVISRCGCCLDLDWNSSFASLDVHRSNGRQFHSFLFKLQLVGGLFSWLDRIAVRKMFFR